MLCIASVFPCSLNKLTGGKRFLMKFLHENDWSKLQYSCHFKNISISSSIYIFLKRKTFSVKDTFPHLIRRTFTDILYRIREIYKFYIYTQFKANHTLWQDQDVSFWLCSLLLKFLESSVKWKEKPSMHFHGDFDKYLCVWHEHTSFWLFLCSFVYYWLRSAWLVPIRMLKICSKLWKNIKI